MTIEKGANMAIAMLIVLFGISSLFTVDAQVRANSGLPPKKTICYYNSTSFLREG